MLKKKSTLDESTKDRVANLNIALQNLVEGKGTLSEIDLLKQSLQTGEIRLGGILNNTILISGSKNGVQLSPEALNLLKAKVDVYSRSTFQVPPLPINFIGRERELFSISERIKGKKEDNVNVITGLAGVGKTALAIMVANSVKESFPDGVVFIDFRGNSKEPLDTNAAMMNILDSLSLSFDISPAWRQDEIIFYYREFLRDKNVLLIFDNVESESQVKFLLPSTPSQAIVISRKELGFKNSYVYHLGVFSEEDAFRFLVGYSNKISWSEEDVMAIASACGYYPLALQYAVSAIQNLYLTPKEFLSRLPPEILQGAQSDPVAIYTYFSRIVDNGLERESKPERPIKVDSNLNESKILFVGQGSVGKTSLIKRILKNTFSQNQAKTDGISISLWQIENQNKIDKPPSKIQLNVWDFGGQEIMHATHQFFLTKRSLYLLVLDSRLTQEENRVEYWLKIIQSFGGEAPVLIIGNKIDQHPLDIDRTGLQRKYSNLAGIFETSAATGEGIEALKTAIAKKVSQLPHIHTQLPQTWFAVKNKMEGLGRKFNFITHDKYLELCAENEVSDETSQQTLIGFLHDLGVILYFQDDYRLSELGILNPQWVTNGVYKILNSQPLFKNKGALTVSMLDKVLNLPDYPRGKRLFIVDMMKKFELCYDIEPDKTFLVPDLLPKDEPAELKFNGVPAFEYAYPVLPSSVITRFIVRMNQKIDDGLVWRTGVVLKIGENKALVKADIEDRKITIAIDGLEHTRRDALSAIRYQLDEIHNSIKGLDAQKRVPIPNAPNAEPLEYEYLLMLEREGDETCRVKDGNRLVTINVRQILSGIESESARKESGNRVTNIYIGGDVKDSNILAGDENEVKK